MVKKEKKAVDAAERGMKAGMQFFSGKIQKEQMSGRPGIRTISGSAKRSWHVTSKGVKGGIVANLKSSSKYLPVHQYGATIKPKTSPYLHFKTSTGWVKTKQVKIPKRLHIIEEFRKSGADIISKRVVHELVKAYK